MTILFRGLHSQGRKSAPIPDDAGEVSVQKFSYTFAASTGMGVGDIIEIGELPQGCSVVDVVLIPDDMDTGAALTHDVGIMSGVFGAPDATRTCDNVFIAGSVAARTGVIQRMSAPGGFRVAPDPNQVRGIGIKCTAAAAGIPATAMTIDLLVSYCPSTV